MFRHFVKKRHKEDKFTNFKIAIFTLERRKCNGKKMRQQFKFPQKKMIAWNWQTVNRQGTDSRCYLSAQKNIIRPMTANSKT